MKKTGIGLSGNQLKLMALLCMTVDHIGMMLMPRQAIFRIIGRLAFPIYGYMIAEGCHYTRSMKKYLLGLLAVAALCQIVYFVAMDSVYMCIMVTFAMSVGLIWLIKNAREKQSVIAWSAVAAGVFAAFFTTQMLPDLLPKTDFGVDYGFLGVMLPVVVYLCDTKAQKLLAATAVLCLLSLDTWQILWFSLLAVPLLALYNGRRGKRNLKWLFYLYYPAHLGIIWLIGQWLRV